MLVNFTEFCQEKLFFSIEDQCCQLAQPAFSSKPKQNMFFLKYFSHYLFKK